MMSSYHRNIWDRALMALTRSSGEWLDSEVSIMWDRPESAPKGHPVLMSYRDPFINESFSFSPKVRKKLEGQLSRAREAGYRTLLILDQDPPRSTPWVGDIIPTPYEIGEGIAIAVTHPVLGWPYISGSGVPQTCHTPGASTVRSGHSRVQQPDASAKQSALLMPGSGYRSSKLGLPFSSLHDDLGRVHRVKAKPLRGRFASPDTTATAKRRAATRRTDRTRTKQALSVQPSA